MEILNYDYIKYLYEVGACSAMDVADQVDMGNITPEDFHKITSFNYYGIKGIKKEGSN